MNLWLAVLIVDALIAGAIAISNRYQLSAHACGNVGGDCSRAWRIDQWTGQMRLCEFASDSRTLGAACVVVRQP